MLVVDDDIVARAVEDVVAIEDRDLHAGGAGANIMIVNDERRGGVNVADQQIVAVDVDCRRPAGFGNFVGVKLNEPFAAVFSQRKPSA